MESLVLFVLLFATFLSFPAVITSFNVKEWCAQTPNPEPCEFFLTQKAKTNTLVIKEKSEFKKMAMQVALDRAVRAEGVARGLRFQNAKEKAAWEDCMELYEDTMVKINKTIEEDGKCSDDDSQTWLSAALTNLETCGMGFEELGVADRMLPVMTNNNVSKLICNMLAINKDGSSGKREVDRDGYPGWVSPGDRKLLQAASPGVRADVVVAADGSGNFRTVKEGIDAAAKRKGGARFVVHVKAGVYKENVVADKVNNLMLVGDGMGKTVITGSKSVGGGSTTFQSATFAVTGTGFIARDITFRNTAGPQNHQAVALRSGCDLSIFYRCGFEGYQDTLYVYSQRQFYKECDIHGTVDYIFGNAAVVLQNCNIYARAPMSGQKCTVTAQGRTDPNQNTGISIHNSRLLPDSNLGSTQTFLGRPWKEYSRTVYLQTYMGRHIAPAGWMEWSGNFALNTLYYGEYKNSGPGGATTNRVKWGGYRVITSPAEAAKFTVGSFVAGNSWISSAGVPFTSGL